MIETICSNTFGSASAHRKAFASVRSVWAPVLLGALAISSLLLTTSTLAQNRDHLTDQESELVRNNQELDKRTEVFIKAIDRRFAIINGAVQPATQKKPKKDDQDWGEPPKGTRAELLSDIAGILDEAITNIDDVSRRDEKNPLLSRSLRKLTSASNGYLTQLAGLKNQAKEDELAAIERALGYANQIVEVGNKLPPPSSDSNNKKKKP